MELRRDGTTRSCNFGGIAGTHGLIPCFQSKLTRFLVSPFFKSRLGPIEQSTRVSQLGARYGLRRPNGQACIAHFLSRRCRRTRAYKEQRNDKDCAMEIH